MNIDNSVFVSSMKSSRFREKTKTFYLLFNVVGDLDLADVVWIYWGENSLRVLDEPMRALNPRRVWWRMFFRKKTIRVLLKTEEGRQELWRMLHSASAWL